MIQYNPLRGTWAHIVSVIAGHACPHGSELMVESMRKDTQQCVDTTLWYLKRHSDGGPWTRVV